MKKLILIIIMLSFIGCLSQEKEPSKYQVTIYTRDGGDYYIEVITQANFANFELPIKASRKIELEAGTHTLVWSYANINGYGMTMNQKSKVKDIEISKDTEITIEGSKVTVK